MKQEQQRLAYGWLVLLVIVRRASPGGCCVNDLCAVSVTFRGAFYHWALLLHSITGHD